ncbi:alpha/beta fold hydrolase [Alteribacillus sp. YIM 98480]|uniref:alpha/beta fold hydrolase n=1 Tax=Alteribacillus sp. YIM 98480 TaxID=2606599 RepID=UPI00131B15EF|nr:alpha/beta hydrolase [Alteribacillus sp. YIM 98480]
MANQENNKLQSIIINGQEITYDINGSAEGPVIVLLSGWCQDHRLFDYIVKPLSDQHKVIRMNWRGHTDPQSSPGDFGAKDQADDVIGVLNALDIDQVIPVSTSHGGWANLEITERLGTQRVPKSILIDWIMVEAMEEFTKNLKEIQNLETWFMGRQSLFNHWIGVSHNQTVKDHLDIEMASWGYDMWERACRQIEKGYQIWGSPLNRMASLPEKRPIVHIYSQAAVEGYEEIQKNYKEEHPWFDFIVVPGDTHFPTLESPEAVVNHINEFVSASSLIR